jgi:hypothetical protein
MCRDQRFGGTRCLHLQCRIFSFETLIFTYKSMWCNTLEQRFPCCVACPPRGALLVLWGNELFRRGTFILNEIRVQGKIYNLVGTCLKNFTYHLLLVLVVTPNSKQHILTPANLINVCYSLAELYISTACLN